MPLVSAPLRPDVPSLQAPAVDPETGRWTQAWAGFFRRFSAGAMPLQSVAVGASPLLFTAPGPGDLVLSGGAGIAATLTRGRASVAVPGAVVPLAPGDAVSVAFTAAPAATFVPRSA